MIFYLKFAAFNTSVLGELPVFLLLKLDGVQMLYRHTRCTAMFTQQVYCYVTSTPGALLMVCDGQVMSSLVIRSQKCRQGVLLGEERPTLAQSTQLETSTWSSPAGRELHTCTFKSQELRDVSDTPLFTFEFINTRYTVMLYQHAGCTVMLYRQTGCTVMLPQNNNVVSIVPRLMKQFISNLKFWSGKLLLKTALLLAFVKFS